MVPLFGERIGKCLKSGSGLDVRGDLGENGKFSPPPSAHEDTPLLELRFPIAVIRSFPNPHHLSVNGDREVNLAFHPA